MHMSLERVQYLCKIVEDKVGLHLTDDKMYLVETRLAPVLEKHGYANLESLDRDLRIGACQTIVTEVAEALVTHETLFFRDTYPYTYLEKLYIPDIIGRNAKSKHIRIWCAGASTGQEPYSLAMLIREKFPELHDWRIDFFATDVSSQVIEKAEQGIFSHFEIQRGLPVDYVLKYFESQGKTWQVKPVIRNMISFQQQNLQSFNSYHDNIDILMCRNVMLYFQPGFRRMIIDEFHNSLKEKGILILGNTEASMSNRQDLIPALNQAGIFIKASAALQQAS